jgi:hypothetical protein
MPRDYGVPAGAASGRIPKSGKLPLLHVGKEKLQHLGPLASRPRDE